MSRRSLRLDNGLLDRSLPLCSASFSTGGSSWRKSRLLRSRQSQQLSSSYLEPVLVHTPHLSRSSPTQSLADASLLSSLLDESSIQETTLVDTLWGLNEDVDPKESTLITEQSSTLIASVQTLSRVSCSDCESDRKQCGTTSRSTGWAPSSLPEGTVYCRDRGHQRSAVLGSVWVAAVSLCRKSAACVVSLLAVLYHQLLRPKLCHATGSSCHSPTTAAAHLRSDSLAAAGGSVASKVTEVNVHTGSPDARWSRRGVMKPTEPSTDQEDMDPVGSLCDVCQDRERLSVTATSSATALLCWLLAVVWNLAVFTVWMVGQLTHTAVVHPLTRKLCSTCRRRAVDSCRWLSRPWRHMASNILIRSVLLAATPLLVLTLLWFGPLSVRPWQTAGTSGPSSEPHAAEQLLHLAKEEVAADVPTRLQPSVTSLWARMEADSRQAQRIHSEVLQRYANLDRQLSQLRRRLDWDRCQRSQDETHQWSEVSRLEQLEVGLQTLATTMEEVMWRQEAAAILPAAASTAADPHSHKDEGRVEAELQDIRRDVNSLYGRLDALQTTISAQVRQEVGALLYGGQPGGGASRAAPSEPLVHWLSQQYITGASLQAALASLERRLLQNIRRQRHHVTLRDMSVVAAATVSRQTSSFSSFFQDVASMVASALQLFAEDRTSQVDFALESAGGSIVSSSDTYESRTVLLSLFGIPLRYFYRTPRAVIQPDVHPGNCWAFKGSTGFLVIRLSMRIRPTAFTLEHVPRALVPGGSRHSAPRHFRVYAVDEERQERTALLGSYTYEQDGDALQTYPVAEASEDTVHTIQLQVLSNWGHREYTCLYRFRVHGTPHNS